MIHRGSPARTVFLGLCVAFGFLLLLRLFVVDLVRVQGSSMEPIIHDQQTLIINKFVYGLEAPARGDVVLFRNPLDDRLAVKRCVGVPDDPIRILNGRYLSIADRSIRIDPAVARLLEPMKRLPHGTYFLLGDNYDNSLDSRHYGLVSGSRMIGRVYTQRHG